LWNCVYLPRLNQVAAGLGIAFDGGAPFDVDVGQAPQQILNDCAVFSISNIWSLAQHIPPVNNQLLPRGSTLARHWRYGVARDICWGVNPFDLEIHSRHFV